MSKVCKTHQDNPAYIYGQCIGCEIEYYQKKLKEKDEEIVRLNNNLKEIKQNYENSKMKMTRW
ncbi:hypothetical protein [Paenibacillus donghaensis]|uniref:Uncharacterized protein n=1 Tax=Paenibacillus donghaensis TaxID=414771 RepID=A0A2Z2KHB8_9BACL|nr:hypothetical protein [Paenibacillus donghaensis]ASA22570.1 hypothetical protein B9T62_18345 [Paenibacillus donghaensis]